MGPGTWSATSVPLSGLPSLLRRCCWRLLLEIALACSPVDSLDSLHRTGTRRLCLRQLFSPLIRLHITAGPHANLTRRRIPQHPPRCRRTVLPSATSPPRLPMPDSDMATAHFVACLPFLPSYPSAHPFFFPRSSLNPTVAANNNSSPSLRTIHCRYLFTTSYPKRVFTRSDVLARNQVKKELLIAGRP